MGDRGDRGDRMGEQLNRSRRERLNKAAKQGYGPLVDMGIVQAPGLSRYPDRQSDRKRSRSRRRSRSRSHRRDKESSRRSNEASLQDKAESEDEADVDGFLAPKRPGAVQKKASGPSKLQVRISANTNTRAIAANAGARPKAAPMKGQDAEMLRQRQLEEKAAQEFEQMQSEAKRLVKGDDVDVSPTSDRERSGGQERERKREEKRKREEWRKQWKEEKKRREKEHADDSRRQGHRSGAKSSSSSDEGGGDGEEQDPKQRFMVWRALNNNGVTTRGDVQRKYVGQVTDAALDQRLREHGLAQGSGKLMTEAEALAKLQRKK